MHWYGQLEAYTVCERMADGMYTGNLDYKKTQELRQDFLRQAGFMVPMDTEFQEYYRDFCRHKPFSTQKTIALSDGNSYSNHELEYNRLRRKMIEAVKRIKETSDA